MRITKRLCTAQETGAADRIGDGYEDAEDNVIEDDEEVLEKSHRDSRREVLVIYDIVHSLSYQVPVLYLSLRRESHAPQPASPRGQASDLSSDSVYNLLVPPLHRSQVQRVGVMGALSMTDHPFSGTLAYFVHPCQTAQAMADSLGKKAATPEEYLMVWMGMIGGSVGLNVPVEMARYLLDTNVDAG